MVTREEMVVRADEEGEGVRGEQRDRRGEDVSCFHVWVNA